MRFEWDENKRLINLKNHGIDFADVWQMFENETHTIIDDRFDYEETRFFTLGLINGRVFAVAHTENDEIIRIISARKADKDDEAKYFKKIRN
ncbi:MAG: BrnT family toxin [Acidobacteriota bacterium]